MSEIINKIKMLPVSGKVQALIRGILFVNAAFFIGLWLGIKIFLPDDFVLSKINEQLFVKDMALISEDVDISLLGNVSFEDGTLMQKGNKVITFSELVFSPSLFATMGGHPAGKVHAEDINSQGGGLDATFETNENPCYSLDASEIPLSILKPFLAEIVLTGSISGGGQLCSKEGKYSGKVDLKGDDVVLRGKIPTPMGDFDVGKIILGEIELVADIVENKAEIKKFSVKGIVELDATGKINLNIRNSLSSRLDLEVNAKIPDMAKISENVALNLLVSQLSEYKGDSENSFTFMLKGFLNKPQMSKSAKKEREQKGEQRSQKKASTRPQRLQRGDRLPQRETLPKPEPPAPAAAENAPQNDDLKKKEDELKRKEEELKQKEEAAKEREEKMREEREQREKEERERKEEEEKKRIEEEARIHAAQEEAMNEIRKVREEMEAAKRARETQEDEGEAEPPKGAPEEKNENEEE
ncbi:type II secretion system protein GspN [bacterium]|nr:type II secretion system protein GspN [bacterium]